MNNVLQLVFWGGATIGASLCLVGGIARLLGYLSVASFEPITLFIGGVGVMVAACLAKLQELSTR